MPSKSGVPFFGHDARHAFSAKLGNFELIKHHVILSISTPMLSPVKFKRFLAISSSTRMYESINILALSDINIIMVGL